MDGLFQCHDIEYSGACFSIFQNFYENCVIVLHEIKCGQHDKLNSALHQLTYLFTSPVN